MEVVVPYTRLRQETVEALDKTGHPYRLVDVSESDSAYFDLLNTLWSTGGDFILVEHDVVVNPDTLDNLENCSQEWCSVTIDYFGKEYPGLGCAKFSLRTVLDYPNVMTQVGKMYDATHPPKHWCRLDAWIVRSLPCRQHVHFEHLKHIRDGDRPTTPTHGCENRGGGVPSYL